MEQHTKVAELDLVIRFWLSMDKTCLLQNRTLLPYNYKYVCVCVIVCVCVCKYVCACVCV